MSIEIKQITKFYGSTKALDDVSFTVNRGEMLGFLGPNGAGKSTLMKIMTGFMPESSGEIMLNGTKVTTDSIDVRREIGYLPENNPLYGDLYVAEYLDIIAGFYKLKTRSKRVSEIIGLTGLQNEQRKKIRALSKGYRQRVGLAQALIHDPSVLILDEPTSGLDPNQLIEIRSLISEIAREKTVIMSSHILQEIEAICQRIVIINKGKLVADRKMDDLKNNDHFGPQRVYVKFQQPVTSEQLKAIGNITRVTEESGGWLITSASATDLRPDIFRFAVSSDLVILELVEKQQNLEDIFRLLTQ
jgi:ABC-2 type transport system ATP-binding protein